MPNTVMYVSSSGDILGGAERCLLDLAPSIARLGWKPIVVLPKQGTLAENMRTAGIQVAVSELGVLQNRRELRSPLLMMLRFMSTIPAIWRLVALIRAHEARIVHSNTSIVLAGALAAWWTKTPHVWHVREILSGPYWRLLRRVILRFSDRVICISTPVADNVAPPGSTGRERLVIIPDGIDIDFFSLSSSVQEPSRPRVIMVGRINPAKGHELFLRAAGLVIQRAPNVQFYLVGGHLPTYDSLYHHLLDLASTLGLDGNVHFVDHLGRSAVRDLMASAAILVSPSTAPEGGGLVILEAMALERAVVATRHGGPIDIIAHGVNGLLVSPRDAFEMADIIITLLQDRELCRELGAAARRRIESTYSLAQQIEQISRLYREVLAASDARRRDTAVR